MKKLLLILSLCFFALGIAACGAPSNTTAYFMHEELKLQVGDSYKVHYVGKDVEVKSADAEIAKVSVTNVVTALKEGQTKLQLVSGDKVLDELALEVTKSSYIPPEEQMDASIYRISLDVTEKRIYPNGNFTLNAKVYKNNTVCDDQVTWNYGGSENPIISAVSNKNQLTVTGIDYGKTTVTATIGEFTAVCKITVSDLNYQVLSAPVLSGITESEISWNAVLNAVSYNVSVNNGVSWTNVNETSFAYEDANPLKIRVVAVGNGINYEDSDESKLTQQNVKFNCGDRLVFYKDKTVSGATNIDKVAPFDLELFVNVNGEDVKITNQQFKLEKTNVITIDGNKITAVNEGEAEISLVDVEGITLTAVVGTPIKTRADMDVLGFAYKNGNNNELWAYGRVYLLANDIDYAQDVGESEKGLRMVDNNSDADLWDRYLIPIAASQNGGTAMGASMSAGALEWGIFGAVGKDGQFFRAIFDGNNHKIENAVIPYGTMFCYGQGINAIINNNFIGGLAYGAKLCNVAFTNLEFEDPMQIASAGRSNPYYTDANANLNGTKLKTNGYISNSGSSIFTLNYGSWQGLNNSNYAGLVGSISNAVVENVFVEAVMKNATWTKSSGYSSGLIVARIDKDYYENGQVYMGTYGMVQNCVTITSYWSNSNVGYNDAVYNAGMGAVVGRSFTERAKSVTNCFAISIPTSNSYALNTDKVFVPFGVEEGTVYSTNSKAYKSIEEFVLEQSHIIPQISVLRDIEAFNFNDNNK